MTPQEFYDACVAFDWRYERSDNAEHKTACVEKELQLMQVALTDSVCDKLWRDFTTHAYYNGAKPVRPT